MNRTAKRIFVLSPHADDAELGVGGYLAKAVDQGAEVMVALATAGTVQHFHGSEVTGSQRLDEFHAAMAVLGVQQVRVLTQERDGELPHFSYARMVGMLDALQRSFQPDEILLPLPSAHQDHTYCWEVGIAMTRPHRVTHVPALVAGYEYPLTSWGQGAGFSAFRGGLYIDVSATWTRKLQALRQHVSQFGDADGDPLALEGVAALARLRGAEAGFGHAELLHVVRQRWF
ncbi:PIG-L deacetylase family protein [Melaminivora suipulveris]|nr:PIG-L deacetylase family protein [Melaminivora suipulveris]